MRQQRLKQKRFSLCVKGIFILTRTAKQWHRTPREVAQSLSLEAFRIQPDKALSSWGYSRPCFEQETGLESFSSPFRPELLDDPT